MINMKKVLLIVMLLSLVLVFAGCDDEPVPVVKDVPEVVDVVADSEIVCEGGQYNIFYREWSKTGCEGDEQVAGTYWKNFDGRMFLLGKPVDTKDVWDIYGECPETYIEEIK